MLRREHGRSQRRSVNLQIALLSSTDMCCSHGLVCNTPAILSFDPFPNYQTSSSATASRRKRDAPESAEEHDDDDIDDDSPAVSKSDALELKKLRQQVDEVLQKVSIGRTRISTSRDQTGYVSHSLPVSTSVSPKANIAMITIPERSIPTGVNGTSISASCVNATYDCLSRFLTTML